MQTPPGHRFRSLDSLRGIAALIVVVHHLALVLPQATQDEFAAITLPLVLSGRFAVMVFFVLSGFVLALPYFDDKDVPYVQYIVRRFCRVYIPFAFAVVVSGVCCALIGGPYMPMFSKWINEFWAAPVTGQLIAQQLLMTGSDGLKSISLDPPIWSLIVEMRISILFPLLVLCVRRFGWASVTVALVLAYGCGKLQIAIGEKTAAGVPESVIGTFLFTGRYVILFLLGVIMAARLSKMKELARSLSPKRHATALAGLMAVWLVLAYKDFETSHSGAVDVFCGVFAMYLIALCVTFPKLSLRLSGTVWLWLGDISYSLYLIHMPVMLVVFYLLHPYASLPVMVAVSFSAALIAGHVMHYLVERPSMTLGRKLSARLKAAR
jgi:peptidoglycan/LPS O-acetylase OafA/YrhL